MAEKATSLKTPLSTEYAAQVIFGTAPVNLAEYPEKAVNTPIMANSFEEAKAALGYSEDWKNYTLCQSMDASYNLFQVSPVIFVNVLDPERHVKELEEMTVPVSNGQAIVASIGILLKDLTVKMATESEQEVQRWVRPQRQEIQWNLRWMRIIWHRSMIPVILL